MCGLGLLCVEVVEQSFGHLVMPIPCHVYFHLE